MDCTAAGKDTCSKFSVTGYPTVKIFRYGEFAEDYNGGRDAGKQLPFSAPFLLPLVLPTLELLSAVMMQKVLTDL